MNHQITPSDHGVITVLPLIKTHIVDFGGTATAYAIEDSLSELLMSSDKASNTIMAGQQAYDAIWGCLIRNAGMLGKSLESYSPPSGSCHLLFDPSVKEIMSPWGTTKLISRPFLTALCSSTAVVVDMNSLGKEEAHGLWKGLVA